MADPKRFDSNPNTTFHFVSDTDFGSGSWTRILDPGIRKRTLARKRLVISKICKIIRIVSGNLKN